MFSVRRFETSFSIDDTEISIVNMVVIVIHYFLSSVF